MYYITAMIKSIKNKALKRLWVANDASKIAVAHQNRVKRILAMLDAAETPEETNLPGYRFHGLQGKPKRYALTVSGNWRVTFGWDDKDAINIDYEDYH